MNLPNKCYRHLLKEEIDVLRKAGKLPALTEEEKDMVRHIPDRILETPYYSGVIASGNSALFTTPRYKEAAEKATKEHLEWYDRENLKRKSFKYENLRCENCGGRGHNEKPGKIPESA